MTTKYYFKDAYPPTAPTAVTGTKPTWTKAIDDAHASMPITKINYILYDNTTVFGLYTTWCRQNKLTTNTNDTDYTGRVIGL